VRFDDVTSTSEIAGCSSNSQFLLGRDGALFEKETSNPEATRYVTLGFSRVRDEHGLNAPLHDLRHFAATSMLVSGQDVRTVSGRLGNVRRVRPEPRRGLLELFTDAAPFR
jgi:site-specific recombinase XerC